MAFRIAKHALVTEWKSPRREGFAACTIHAPQGSGATTRLRVSSFFTLSIQPQDCAVLTN